VAEPIELTHAYHSSVIAAAAALVLAADLARNCGRLIGSARMLEMVDELRTLTGLEFGGNDALGRFQ
jgi:hypothetical protein